MFEDVSSEEAIKTVDENEEEFEDTDGCDEQSSSEDMSSCNNSKVVNVTRQSDIFTILQKQINLK